MTKKNTVSAVEAIEKQIAELEALKVVVENTEGIIEAYRFDVKEYERQIEESEAAGTKVDEDDWRRNVIKEARAKIAAFQTILDKLTK